RRGGGSRPTGRPLPVALEGTRSTVNEARPEYQPCRTTPYRHTQVLALFDRSGRSGYRGLDPERTTVDHLAFEIDMADYELEKTRLEGLGAQVTTAEHAWVRWRSLYVDDPRGTPSSGSATTSHLGVTRRPLRHSFPI